MLSTDTAEYWTPIKETGRAVYTDRERISVQNTGSVSAINYGV